MARRARFSLKFLRGKYDLVDNNTPVFFVRDPRKFPHFIRSQKRLPDSGLRDNHMQWDFWANSPESAHQVTERGLPRTWRHMSGYGSAHLYVGVLPAGGQATPMVYEMNGRQYLVIMPGGQHFMEPLAAIM